MNHLIKSLMKPLWRSLSAWAMVAIFSTANAATSFVPPLPQPKKVQPAPVVISHPIQTSPKTLTEYWGLSYNLLTIDNPGISSTSLKVLMVKVGHHLSNSLALETRIAIPTVDETVTWNGQSANQRVNVLAELQLRKGFINVQGVEAYGLFGLSYTNLSTAVIQSSTLQQVNRENTDLSYGLGIRGRLGQTNIMGYAEYNRLLGQANFNLSRVSFGIDYYF